MRSSDLFLLFLAVFPLSMHYSCSLIHSAKIEGAQALYNCSSNNTFTPNSIYHDNVKTLMSWFSSNASTRTTGFYSTTVAGKNISDTVYGLFWCGYGDAVPRNCHECVINATKWMTSFCAISKEAIIWQEWCFMRYSNHYFLSTMEESPQISLLNNQDYIGQVGLFNSKIWDLMNDLRTEATNALVGSSRYAYKGVNIEQDKEIYGSAWCIPYLSTENCSWCLSDAIATIPTSCCRGKTGGRVFFPSCGVRFELYPFSQPVASTSSGLSTTTNPPLQFL
ncbi:hypothetical protein L6164_035840 [Bauhinia variegata]|uniref:Uncharacterized protein n=1 Tax=Bauhinia variegata TaxID=167791 RepID=A0ACB9KF91_BAUVA|nr:hypothetical protein L6164_035840 [Bauhinia variegata]